ncbi:MAG: ribosome-associated translation inhibitor RaiA, partial [Armatimonadota bacterium]|nr:ribosome-associated translation inhibitor RaiA [Armatimonadota bacterium]
MNTNNQINWEVHAHHCEVEPALRAHIEEKVLGLGRIWPKIDDAHVRMTNERGRCVAEITLISGGMLTRAEEIADNQRLAFDNAMDKLERQLRRYKNKMLARERRHDNRDEEALTILNPSLMAGSEVHGSLLPPAGMTDASTTSVAGPTTGTEEAREAKEQERQEEAVVRVKRFALKPMSPEEAALQMD